MAELPKDPKGAELEEWVSAHFASRGCYVETSIKERSPDEILELDVVWTDYRNAREARHPVEVKSGDWGLGDVFKFYGWTQCLELDPGQFVHTKACAHDPASVLHVQKRTGINFLHIEKLESVEEHLAALGLPNPASTWLTQLWQFSFWARRRLVKSLGVAISSKTCPESAKAAKRYLQLINDLVFFIPDPRDRVEKLLETHFEHQQLGKSAAFETETKIVQFGAPPDTQSFKRAFFDGIHFPVQACMYIEHRARLYILKALVDFWLARERGELAERRKNVVVLRGKMIASQPVGITAAMENAIAKLSGAKSFRFFPVLWQTLLWSWGGFILTDRIEEEYVQLEKETGVPVEEIPLALTAFDEIFPIRGGWFREPDERRLLILMPPVMRGLGAHRRKLLTATEKFADLKHVPSALNRMISDNNALANLLDYAETDLSK